MISVCMATYNGEQFVEQQILSILPQLGEDDELVVSDDGSTDSTVAVISRISDKRIRLFHNARHGFKWNFLNALTHSSGDIIFLADQDDVWLPGKVEACVAALQNVDLVVHNSSLADEGLNVWCDSFFKFYHSGPGLIKNSLNNTYFGACMAMRRSVFVASLPFPQTDEIGHDIWLGLVAEMVGKVCFLPEVYIIYRRHDAAHTNLTQGLFKRSKRSLARKIWSRVVVLSHVLKYRLSHRKEG